MRELKSYECEMLRLALPTVAVAPKMLPSTSTSQPEASMGSEWETAQFYADSMLK